MKRLVVLFLASVFLLSVGAALARPVSENEAMSVAERFIAGVFGPSSRGGSWAYENLRHEPGIFVCERVLTTGASITLMVGATTEMPPVLLYYHGRPLEVASRERCLEVAREALADLEHNPKFQEDFGYVPRRVYYSPLDFWFEYEAGGRTVMVSPRDFQVYDPARVRDAEPISYPAKLSAGFAEEWRNYLAGRMPFPTDDQHWIAGVPDYDWHYGCAPTAAANVLAYWDSRGYPTLVDSVQYNIYDPVEHDYDSVPNASGQLAEAMNTDLSNGGTRVDSVAPGIMLVCDSAVWENGYHFNSYLEWDNLGLMISEIRNDRPGVFGMLGHPTYINHAVTFCGYGPPDTNYIMIHDEWGNTPLDVVIYYFYSTTPHTKSVIPVIPGGAVGTDAGVTSIVQPDVAIPPGDIEPKATVVNFGSSASACSVVCRISRPGGGFYESFTGSTFPPAGWHEFHPDMGTYNWYRTDSSFLSPPAAAACQRELSLWANDDWLVSPRVRVRERDTVFFWYCSLGPVSYPESIEVWVSYTDEQPASFVDCIQAFDFTNSSYNLGWADFSTVGDTFVYIGFRYGMKAGLGGTGICLDDIQLRTDYYLDTVEVTLTPGQSQVVSFGSWNAREGHYACRCSVYQAGDANPDNDVKSRDFLVSRTMIPPSNWTERRAVPEEPSMAPVKDGGCLTYMPGKGLIFATKGNKVGDFYSYNPGTNTWYLLPPVEGGTSEKPPKKGTRIAADNNRYVYVVKGNNTSEFWRYEPDSTGWESLEPVLPGASGKKVKGGGDMVYVPAIHGDPEYVYLLKGYKSEFYRYNIGTGHWEGLSDAPWVVKNKYPEGSFLVYDGDRTIYCQQAGYYIKNRLPDRHSLFKYDIVGDAWSHDTLDGMPLLGMVSGRLKEKKSKDGGSAAWFAGRIYALKGGNTQQFFRGDPVSGVWQELDTVPSYTGTTGRKRKVKNGADIVSVGNAFYVLKGNKTRELWRYAVPTHDASGYTQYAGSGVMAGVERNAYGVMRVSPNPIASGVATVRFSGLGHDPKSSADFGHVPRLTVRVFDAAGRCVLGVQCPQTLRNDGVVALQVDCRKLSSGVYLVRLDTGGCSATQKLVVQR